MEDKNRFGKLLDQMLTAVDLKKYTLSNVLKYDVSYISKWVNGHTLPSEKTAEQTIATIIQCIIDSANEEQKARFIQDYQVRTEQELVSAMYDHLKCEYDYARMQQKTQNVESIANVAYYPELSLAQFISRMSHPVLRRVSSLNIMASMDLLSMEHEYRLQIVDVQHEGIYSNLYFPHVHFSLSIDISQWADNLIYDTIFLFNLLSSSTHVDFKLYGSNSSRSHVVFAVENDFVISGLLMDQRRCLSVVASEDSETAQTIYYSIQNLCVRENLLFRKTSMLKMVGENVYLRTLLAQNNRWLIGHLTEHFLPDDLFEELLEQNWSKLTDEHIQYDKNVFRKLHQLTSNMLESVTLRVLVYETAFQDLIVNHQIDFFDQKVMLTDEQCRRYLQHVFWLVQNQLKSNFRLIHGQFVSDYRYVTTQCLFLNDAIAYLRLDSEVKSGSTLLIANRLEVREQLERFFEAVWSEETNSVISDRDDIHMYLDDTLQHIQIIYGLE